ncbi:MAG: phage antirepressor Ant [Firmicutes bacterium]|nr:phage antirepressor Ant [Bacillota bacterium]
MNNNLGLIVKGDKVVVSSKDVAIKFDKRHDNVMRDIDNLAEGLLKSEEALEDYFTINYQQNEQNKQKYRCYDITRKGFQLLAMGFNGQKALDWKVKYIKAFEMMESELQKPKKLSPMEQLRVQYEALEDHDARLTNLENNMTIDYSQQETLKRIAQSKVIVACGGKETPSYKSGSMRNKVFAKVWRDYKDYFEVNSYKNTPRKEFQEAKDYLNNWTLLGKLKREVDECNYQLAMSEVSATIE